MTEARFAAGPRTYLTAIAALIATILAPVAVYIGEKSLLQLVALLCMLYAATEFRDRVDLFLGGGSGGSARPTGVGSWANEIFYWVVLIGFLVLFIGVVSGRFA